MRIYDEVVKTRTVFGENWEMQVAQIASTGKFQATYYHGADERIWGKTTDTREAAIASCDEVTTQNLGKCV